MLIFVVKNIGITANVKKYIFKAFVIIKKRKEQTSTIPQTCFRSPTELRETKIDNQGIDYQKVDTSAQIEQTDNNSNRDVSKHPFCLFSISTKLIWDDFIDKSCLGQRAISYINFLLGHTQKYFLKLRSLAELYQ